MRDEMARIAVARVDLQNEFQRWLDMVYGRGRLSGRVRLLNGDLVGGEDPERISLTVKVKSMPKLLNLRPGRVLYSTTYEANPTSYGADAYDTTVFPYEAIKANLDDYGVHRKLKAASNLRRE